MQLYYDGVWLKLFRKITGKTQFSHENLNDAAGKQLWFSRLFSHSLHRHLPFGIVHCNDPSLTKRMTLYHVIQE